MAGGAPDWLRWSSGWYSKGTAPPPVEGIGGTCLERVVTAAPDIDQPTAQAITLQEVRLECEP